MRDLTGFEHILPTHQGRASERILFELVRRPRQGRSQQHALRHHARQRRAFAARTAVDLPIPEGHDPRSHHPFKGNMDVAALERLLAEHGRDAIPLVMITVTNNSGGGQPVSLENIRAVRAVCDRHGVPLFLDACRFAENAWFIKTREPGQSERDAARDRARDVRRCADGCHHQRQEGRPGRTSAASWR